MKIITSQWEKLFSHYPLYSQEDIKDPLVIAKLFDPCGSATWYVIEYDAPSKTAFAFVTGLHVDEFGYVSLEELEAMKRPFGLSIERDLYFTPRPLSSCLGYKQG